GRKIREGKPSTVIYLRDDEDHADKFHEAGAQIFVIELQKDWLTRNLNNQRLLNNSATYEGGLPAWFSERIYREYRNMDELSPLAIEGLILELIVETSRSYIRKFEFQPQRWLIRAEELIRAHFSECLSLSDVAKTVGVHPVRLTRAFRQHYRYTVGEYVRNLRVEFAREALLTTDAPLTEIALAAG